MVKHVCLDPGHGGHDPGAVGYVVEKEVNWIITQHVKERLEAYKDVIVILTRGGDEYVSLVQRCKIANDANADVFVSIHCNAGGGEGFESYRYPGSVEGARLQAAVHEEVYAWLALKYGIEPVATEAEPVEFPAGLDMDALETWIRDRGQKAERYHVLQYTRMPAILLECLFVDDERDAVLLQDPKFLRELGWQIADGVADYLGLEQMPEEKDDYKVSPEYARAVRLARRKGLSSPGKGHDYTQALTEERFWALAARILRWW